MAASAFSLSSLFLNSSFSVTAGEPIIGGLHGATRHYFCGHCMSWLFTRPDGMDDLVNIRSAMLEDARDYEPFVEMYLDEKLEWAETGAVRSFNKFPSQEMFPTLLEEFAAR